MRRRPALRRLRCDACVIGTGAGGAVAAKELAEGGLRVVVLEEGGPLTSATGQPREANIDLYRDAGQVVTVGNPPIVLPLGRGVGGTTAVNSATCYRTPPAVLAQWRSQGGLESWTDVALRPHLRRAERILGVRRVPRDLAGRNAHVAERGAQRLGWGGEYLHRAARGCVGSGVCAFGCPTGAKQHAGNTYLPRAVAAGAITITGARATQVLLDDGQARARGVRARTLDGGRLQIDCELVVVACGAVGTPMLLRRSGFGGLLPALGRNLSLHPAAAVWAEMDEVVDMAVGVPQSYAVDEFADRGVMLEGWAGPPDMLALGLPAGGAEHRRLMLGFRRMAQFGLMVRDTSRGSVHALGGRAVIRYRLGQHDAARLRFGIERLAELYFAAGALSVHVPVTGIGPLRAGDLRRLRAAPVRARDLSLTAFHPLGTARADAHPGRGVVDAHLRVHGVEGLHVADGSVVPSALGVNPQLTIMALASAMAFTLAGRAAPADEAEPVSVGRAAALVAA